MRLKITIFLLSFIDQIVKIIVLEFFGSLVSFNQGVAFGLFPSTWWPAIIFFLLIIINIKLRQKWPRILILSGGYSNLIDRLFRGAAVDFINFPFFPAFNLADIYICLGAIMLLLNNVSPKNNL